MNVLFATGIYPPDVGGPATYVSHLARELHRRGVGVEVVTYGSPQEEDPSFPVHRVPRHRTVARRYWSFYRALGERMDRADVIYAQDPLSVGLPSVLAGATAGCPVVAKVVGDLAWEIAVDLGRTASSFQEFQNERQALSVELFRFAESAVVRRAATIIVPSRYLGDVVGKWGVAEERISVVHNSLPERAIEKSREEARRELGLEGDPSLLAAGRLVPWKRFDLPIRFLPDVLRMNPSARLTIVGSGPIEADLRELSRELGLEGAVTFRGSIGHEAMMLHLKACDLFLLPSTYEGFSHLLLEAMRTGTAILATDAGGNAEVVGVREGAGGRLVSADSSEDFRTALVELARDRELRERLGGQGRERAQRFAWSSLVERTLDILEKAASRR
jgi:glycosyltransferase involved in cell wall biosynthesis